MSDRFISGQFGSVEFRNAQGSSCHSGTSIEDNTFEKKKVPCMMYDARVHCLKKLRSIYVKIAIAERPIRKYMVKERRCINISEISQLEHFIYVFAVILYQGPSEILGLPSNSMEEFYTCKTHHIIYS